MRQGLRTGNRRQTSAPAVPAGDGAFTVYGLTRRIKDLLEDEVGRVSVTGEIGSITHAHSGHVYLSIKDERAVLDAVMWRSTAGRLGFTPREGDQVIARGQISVYEPRGKYQLVISGLQPVGQGDLQRRFEAMVRKLADEGLFAPEHKQPLPAVPGCVGVATSGSGAAVQDIIKVMRRRWPGVKIVVSPCLVQGESAAGDIVRALERLEAWGGCDVIIVGRGGGSLEDLWPFNEEKVARAIFAARTPIVSAVGHETDFTVADYVADLRAATPSEAAETVVPDIVEYRRRIATLRQGLARPLLGRIREARTRLVALERAGVLRRPMDMVDRRRQMLDELTGRLIRAGASGIESARRRLALVAARLESLSPLGVLARGYSVTMDLASGRVVRSVKQVSAGRQLLTRVVDGEIVSMVEG